MTRTLLAAIAVLTLTAVPRGPAQAQHDRAATRDRPAAWFRFESTATLATDSATTGQAGALQAGTWQQTPVGGVLSLDGNGGLTLPNRESLQLRPGFALECWVNVRDTGRAAGIVTKDGEYLLRLDPGPETSNISFFINLDGTWEPRVRSVVPKVNTWYHLVGTWDGRELTLWVNGQPFRQQRTGRAQTTENPVLIGSRSPWAEAGLNGLLDEVRIHARALDADGVLPELLRSRPPAGGEPAAATEFPFDDADHGWQVTNGQGAVTGDGQLKAGCHGFRTQFISPRLQVPVADKPFVTLRLETGAGERGTLTFRTDIGTRAVPFDLQEAGRPNTYVLRLDQYAQWDGVLTGLALSPSEAECQAGLDSLHIGSEPAGPPDIEVVSIHSEKVIARVSRSEQFVAVLRNVGAAGTQTEVSLHARGQGIRFRGTQTHIIPALRYGERRELSWELVSDREQDVELELLVSGPGMATRRRTVTATFAVPVKALRTDYVPPPVAVDSEILVGAHYCPLWKQGTRSSGWERIVPYPERKPALGWYDEGSPEVADWEIKWCLEHGIRFFVYCWYRRNRGQGVQMFLPHAIHDGLFNARYRDRFKFCIMWENQQPDSGVASEADLLHALLPFWIENYFKHPSYLKIDSKPLLFVYRPEKLVDDLGSVSAVRSALDQMRAECRRAGFSGLTFLGEYRGLSRTRLQQIADEGFDYCFAYVWPLPHSPEPDAAVRMQEDIWQKRRELGVLPEVLTVSMGWDSRPWHPSTSIWRLPPKHFQTVCVKAKQAMRQFPGSSLGRRVVLLDNWNEFGEGHYIAPQREHGFGYLDAVRTAFSAAPEPHLDLVPDDVGRGPYDALFAAYREKQKACRQLVTRTHELDSDLVAWWSFDEPADAVCALDYAGHGLGGIYEQARRVPGLRGLALDCDGGAVAVPPDDRLSPARQLSVECWLKTDVPGQTDRWFLNRILGGATETGYRFGLRDGRLCWALPQTHWSHHLHAAEPLPAGSWVHVVGTHDGSVMRLYMNGTECGAMQRPGRVHANDFPLCIGNFTPGHKAHFQGLLDEVRVYRRALTAADVRSRCAALTP